MRNTSLKFVVSALEPQRKIARERQLNRLAKATIPTSRKSLKILSELVHYSLIRCPVGPCISTLAQKRWAFERPNLLRIFT